MDMESFLESICISFQTNISPEFHVLQDIKKLFPTDCNPFYAGFGNRDTDEFSYRKIGIPEGKIFIINPKVWIFVTDIPFWWSSIWDLPPFLLIANKLS